MTDDNEEWGPWIEHDGSECPVVGKYVCAWFERPFGRFEKAEGIAGSGSGLAWDWQWFGKQPPNGRPGVVPRITSYRVRKPRALLQLRDMVESMPVTVEITEPW